MRRSAKLGLRRGGRWDFPWLGELTCDESSGRDALGRLLKPASRIRERVFWFSGISLDPERITPDTLKGLAEDLKYSTGVSLHDRALLLLLDGCLHDPALQEGERWVSSLTAWEDLSSNQAYLITLQDIEAQAGFEPPTDIGEIRQAVSEVLSLILEDLSQAEGEGADEGGCRIERLLRVLREADLPPDIVEQWEDRAFIALEERVVKLCDELSQAFTNLFEGVGSPEEKQSACRDLEGRFAEEVKPLLQRIDELDGKETLAAKRARIAAVEFLRKMAAAWSAAEDLERSHGNLTLAADLAGGTHLEGRVEAEKRQVSEANEADAALRASLTSPKAVDVVIVGDGCRIPKVCTCCLKPTENTEVLSRSWTETCLGGEIRRSVFIKFPLCPECKAHRSELESRQCCFTIVVIGLVTVGMFLLEACYRWALPAQQIPPGVRFWIGLVLGPVLICLLAWKGILSKVKPLDATHAHRGRSVQIATGYQDRTCFRFFHPLYAAIFSQGNQVQHTFDVTVRKHGRGSSLLDRKNLCTIVPLIIVGSLIGTFVAAMCVVPLFPETSKAATATVRTRSDPSTPQLVSPRPTPSRPPEAQPAVVSQTPKSVAARVPYAELFSLKQQIERGKQEIEDMERRLKAISSDLEGKDLAIQRMKSEINLLELELLSPSGGNRLLYSFKVDQHNSAVEEYNANLVNYRVILDKYEAERAQVSSLIEKYNSLLGR